MKAVIIGAGRVGCGFLAQLLSESGYQVVIVGRRPEVVAAINRGRYFIDVCRTDRSAAVACVDGVRAIQLQDEEAFHEALAGARLIFTAVGATGLKDIATPLANGLLSQMDNLPRDGAEIISCENMPNAITLIKQAIAGVCSTGEWEAVNRTVRFRRAMVWRIVADRRLAQDVVILRGDDNERIDIEAQPEWPTLPQMKGAVSRTDIAEAIHEKLHVFNSGHAVAGYLGYLHGFQYINDALKDDSIRITVESALDEAAGCLGVGNWGGNGNGNGTGTGTCTGTGNGNGNGNHNHNGASNGRGNHYSDFVQGFIERYSNAALSDRTTRVAARPVQKLAPFERLVLPAWAALTAGRTPMALVDGIAAALRFDHWQDAEAVKLQVRIHEAGLERAFDEVTGLRAGDELTQLVLERYASNEQGLVRHPTPLARAQGW